MPARRCPLPFDQIAEATAPRNPSTAEPVTIDLTAIPGGDRAFMKTACTTIKHGVDRLLGPEGKGRRAGHVSVFALGPIPLLVCLGRHLSSKVPNDVYQRHRDTETWTWTDDGPSIVYLLRRLRRRNRTQIALDAFAQWEDRHLFINAA